VGKCLGIRREDKNKWERRVPLIPEDLKALKEKYNIGAVVQPSSLRVYTDEAYAEIGACISEDLDQVDTIFAVKEIPVPMLADKKTYIFFSHTIKGQPYNMDLLRTLMANKCNLIDYERIVNEKSQRLIFFGVHAGYAGIIETLFAFGQKMKARGIKTCLADIRQAYEYDNLDHAKAHVKQIGQAIAGQGVGDIDGPLIVGLAGYGNVSRGAQEILDLLPVTTITPDEIETVRSHKMPDLKHIYKVVFKEADMVAKPGGTFELQDYYDHPGGYMSVMDRFLPDLDILVNCIYWTEDYPRIVTKTGLQSLATGGKPFRLSVIGDISCDIEGSIEITRDATMPDNACFTFHPDSQVFEDGIGKTGVTVMAIDNLPCEFPKESSMFFSSVLKTFAPDILSADFSKPFEALSLPYPIKAALILQNGEFTPDYAFMKQFL
jgi:saccharopine dehydrogenase (NAD+, L-lysine-forming)